MSAMQPVSDHNAAVFFDVTVVGSKKIIFSLPLKNVMDHIVPLANDLLNTGSDKVGYESEVEFTEKGTLVVSLEIVSHH